MERRRNSSQHSQDLANAPHCDLQRLFRFSLGEIVDRVGQSDGIHLLRKPFGVEQVRKLTDLPISKSARLRG